MKLVYIHDTPMPGPDANTINVARMCDAFVDIGHEILLIHPWRGERTSVAAHYGLRHQIRTLQLPRPRIFGGGRSFSVGAALIARAAGADLVYARKPSLLLPALHLGVKVIYEAHAPLEHRQDKDRRAFAQLLKSGKLCRIVAISEALRARIQEEWPEAASRLMVAHDGADPVHVDDPARRGGQPRVGYAGHFYPGKGMEMIYRLAVERPRVEFLVLGGKGADLEHWRMQTRDMPNIRLTGMVPPREVPRHLATCDVVLAPYADQVRVSDGTSDVARWMSPLKIFEYMAQGLPILCSDLPVLREVLQDGVNAVLCPPGDTAAWLSRLDALLADAPRRAELGNAAKMQFEARHSWAKRAERILA